MNALELKFVYNKKNKNVDDENTISKTRCFAIVSNIEYSEDIRGILYVNTYIGLNIISGWVRGKQNIIGIYLDIHMLMCTQHYSSHIRKGIYVYNNG